MAASPHITAAGHARLKAEYDQLWRLRRPEVTRALAAAAAEGDRSENAEYIYRKKELREIDRRVRYLQLRLPLLRVVDRPPSNLEQVFFGAWVQVADEGDRRFWRRIVGADEIGEDRRHVSVDSPFAAALLRRRCGETAVVQSPGGEQMLQILDLRYGEAPVESTVDAVSADVPGKRMT